MVAAVGRPEPIRQAPSSERSDILPVVAGDLG